MSERFERWLSSLSGPFYMLAVLGFAMLVGVGVTFAIQVLFLSGPDSSQGGDSADLGFAVVHDITLEDGTRCALIESNGNGDVGITCNWSAP